MEPSRCADPRIPAAQACVLGPLLEHWAARTPDKTFALFADGSTWTYAQALDVVRRTAAAFQRLGVRRGDNVLSWLPNGADALRVWFGLNYLGAVYVPINISYRGTLLEHVIANAGAKLIVVHPGLAPRLEGIRLSALETAVVTEGARAAEAAAGGKQPAEAAAPASALRRLPASALDTPGSFELPDAATLGAEPWDTQTIIYTSGTTGPSKGVESSYIHLYSASSDPFPYLGADDRYLVPLPLFHVGGTVAVYSMLVRGASVAIVDGFQLDSFWQTVKRTGSTFTVLLASMITLLSKREPGPEDRGHGLRHAVMVPLSEDASAFSRRFGCDIYTLFNMTEVSCPLVSGVNPSPLGTCGKPRDGVQARIVDEHDCEVAQGEVGELVLRTDRPWAMMHGYFRNPEATARAWRNGWFHTGDAFRQDAEGNYFFVDRMKDAIRRRGENISSFEVEAEVASHPDVREAAAVAVPSDTVEDEVLVAIAPVEGRTIDPVALTEYLVGRMAHFMVPRYIRVVADLPRTPTQKVQKHLIRSEGVTPDTWDREQAGIRLRREKL